MTSPWRLSSAVEAKLAEWLASFEESYGAIGYPTYPSVMWSLGGEAWQDRDPVGTHVTLPAGYAAGFYRRDPPPEGDGLVFVPSKRFGLIVFLPRDEDLASRRRLIDFDGKDIVVR